VVLVATIATLRIALYQPDQIATTKPRSRRDPEPGTDLTPDPVSPGPTVAATAKPRRKADRPTDRHTDRRSRSGSPSMVAAPMPAGFQWMDAVPAPKVRSGFALVIILAFLGALLAMAVAGLVAGIAVAIQGI
jgi:hypothetical protein